MSAFMGERIKLKKGNLASDSLLELSPVVVLGNRSDVENLHSG
jgi:hypothetical protein